MSSHPVSAEVSNSKLVAVFPSLDAAREAAASLLDETDLQRPQLRVIEPGEPDLGIRLEPEGGNIWRTVVVSHVRLGLAGALVGAVFWSLLWLMGVGFVLASPAAAAGLALAFGAVGGLLLAGLVSLRPDHSRYIQAARDARDAGQAALVVHALSADQRAQAARCLDRRGAEVTQTL